MNASWSTLYWHHHSCVYTHLSGQMGPSWLSGVSTTQHHDPQKRCMSLKDHLSLSSQHDDSLIRKSPECNSSQRLSSKSQASFPSEAPRLLNSLGGLWFRSSPISANPPQLDDDFPVASCETVGPCLFLCALKNTHVVHASLPSAGGRKSRREW